MLKSWPAGFVSAAMLLSEVKSQTKGFARCGSVRVNFAPEQSHL